MGAGGRRVRCFEQLTARGQVGRLRAVAQAALGQFGFGACRLRLLQHLVNTTFRLDSAAGRYLVRVHRVGDQTPARVESELAWLAALARETAVAVQVPHRAPDGRLVVVAAGPGVPGGRQARYIGLGASAPCPVSVLGWLRGRVLPQERRSPAHFERLGRLVGALHDHSRRWSPPPGFDRPTYDADGLLAPPGGPERGRAELERLPSRVRRDLERLRRRLRQVQRRLGRGGESFGLIHSDLSFGNVLFAGEEAMPIDFDDCGFGYYLYDLAVVLAGPWHRPGFDVRREALLRGYRQVRALGDDVAGLLPAFMAARAGRLLLWAAAESAGHPWIEPQWRRVRSLLGRS